MKPILFSENSTEFTSNGIGRLSDAISCVVTEERNGLYELEMVYPISGAHFSDMGIRSIIAAIPCDGGTMQAFRVYQMTKPINGKVTVYAQHISYDLSKNTAMPFSVAMSASACATTIANLKSKAVEACPFTFWTDVTTAASYNQATPASIKSRLGGVEGSVLDQFGGEYEWDNYTVKLHRQRGTLAINNGITLRYGKNITDITQEENIADTVTGVVPYWADTEGNVVTLPEKVIYSDKHKDAYSQHLTIPLDLSTEFEEQPSVAQLRTAAQVVVNASDFGVPKVSIEVSFVALWQTEEYKDVAPLQRVRLCDEVMVKFEKLGVDTTAKIVKTEYDVLAERYRSVQIGSVRSSLAQTLNDQAAATVAAIAAQAVSTSQAINNATKWLTSAGGYVIAIKNTDGSWKELVFSNMTDPYASNAKILRINNNGMGFSSTGMNGIFRNAWTIDGNLVADFIHGGTLTLGGNGNGNGWLKMVNASNAQIGKWDNGGIDIGAGNINGARITLGGSNNGSGTLTIKDSNGNTIGTWNNGGITMNKGAIYLGTKSGNYYPFQVLNDGSLRATSGVVGGFTIDGSTIRSGNTGDTGDGAVTLSNANFTRAINGTSRANLRLAIGSKLGIQQDGTLYAAGANINGSITSASNGNYTTIGNGRVDISMASGSRNSIHISRGDCEMSIGPNDVTWSGDAYFQADWSDILDVGDHRSVIKRAVNAILGDGAWNDN